VHKDGILKGIYGREQLCSNLDKKKIFARMEVGERYCPAGGKFRYWHCVKDCSLSKMCKCRKAKKFCNQHCHKGNGYNTLCPNFSPIIS
jgi:hypothetical protein